MHLQYDNAVFDCGRGVKIRINGRPVDIIFSYQNKNQTKTTKKSILLQYLTAVCIYSICSDDMQYNISKAKLKMR